MSLNRLLILGVAATAFAALVIIVVVRRRSGSSEPWSRTLRGLVKPVSIVAIVAFVAIQLIPYGRDHTNPPVVAEPPWDSPQTRELAVRACFDCHSNETTWPWYSNIAPMSWLVQRHVDGGRSDVNWSEWMAEGEDDESEESAETIEDGSMPLDQYLWLHPDAKLTDGELEALVAGLTATFGREDD